MSVRLPFQQASRRMFSSSSTIGNAGGIPQTLYKNVWRKSNILYISYIVVGCVAIEAVYGTATTALWDTYNRGVSFFWNAVVLVYFSHLIFFVFRFHRFVSFCLFMIAEIVQTNRLDQVQERG